METKLEKLLAAARTRKMTAEEIEEQRVQCAFGNAPEGDTGTVTDVKAASTYLKSVKVG
jgi:hypothetical protein